MNFADRSYAVALFSRYLKAHGSRGFAAPVGRSRFPPCVGSAIPAVNRLTDRAVRVLS